MQLTLHDPDGNEPYALNRSTVKLDVNELTHSLLFKIQVVIIIEKYFYNLLSGLGG